MPPLRLSLTLSGGASLGAYEAGAAAALALAVRHLDQQPGQQASIDAIGGASAGALVALFTAHALLEGLDPEELLHETWVKRVTLPLLRSNGSKALLSFEELREGLPEVLADRGSSGANGLRQDRPLALHIQVTGLRGNTYPIRGLRSDDPLRGVTYADWCEFELEPGGGASQILEPKGHAPLDFVLASAASPGGFAPQLIDRSADAESYRRRGIDNFPESGHLWYSDGGLLGSQPLSRVIAAARSLHGRRDDAVGVHLLIDPRSETAETELWCDPKADPSWQEGGSRALGVLSQQSLFDDLRHIEKVNSRIEWTERLADELEGALGKKANEILSGFLEHVESELEGMRSGESGRPDHPSGNRRDLLHRALSEIAGTVGKERIEIDVISPLLLADGDDDPGSLLAGDFMGDFGGFLSQQLRASDFALGYESTIAWLGGGLRSCEFDDATVEATLDFVRERRRYDLDEVRSGETELSDLSMADRFQLVRLGLHGARVLGAGALDLRSRIPDGVGNAISDVRGRLPGGR